MSRSSNTDASTEQADPSATPMEELLRRARAAIAPPEDAEERVRRAIEVRKSRPASGRIPRLLGISVGAGVALAGALGAYLAHGTQGRGPSVAVAPHSIVLPSSLAQPSALETGVARPTESSMEEAPATTTPLAPKIEKPTRRATAERVVASASAEAPVAESQPAPKPSDEIALLVQAKSLLARGDESSALARLDEHAAKYPSSYLAQERTRLRIEALCVSGQTEEAKRAFARLVADSPESAHIRSLCRACPALATDAR